MLALRIVEERPYSEIARCGRRSRVAVRCGLAVAVPAALAAGCVVFVIPGGEVIRYQTYEYLPATAANVRLVSGSP